MPEFVVSQNCGTRTQHFECDCCFEPAFPVITELQKDIPGEEEDPTNYEARRCQAVRLMRVRRNLGHPSNRLLVQILTEAKAPKGVIEMARDLKCSICERTKKIASSRPANPLRAREVGEVLALRLLISCLFRQSTSNGFEPYRRSLTIPRSKGRTKIQDCTNLSRLRKLRLKDVADMSR